jgi:hypothetical protein
MLRKLYRTMLRRRSQGTVVLSVAAHVDIEGHRRQCYRPTTGRPGFLSHATARKQSFRKDVAILERSARRG